MNKIERKIYRFAEFELDTGKRMILRQGVNLKINAKAFDLLVVLVENNGNILGKDEILGHVWEGNLIEENNLTVQISKIRKLLNDTKANPRFLKTIPGRGYCFTADVSEIDERETELENQRNISNNDEAQSDNANETIRKPVTNKALSIWLVILIIGILIFVSVIPFIWQNIRTEPFQNVQSEQLTSLSKIENATISPDGKYFAYVLNEPKGESLWVQQTGLSNPIQIVPTSGGQFWGITFTPDSKEIYYSLFFENNPDVILYRISTLGGRIEKVISDVGGSIGFSPDGKRFAFVTSIASREKTFLAIANADGSEEKVLAERKSATGFEINGNKVAWSPDGSLIAAIVKEIDETGEFMKVIGIDSIRPESGITQKITDKRWMKIKDIAWLKNGSGLVMTATERSSMPLQIWYVAYPSGEVRQITGDLDVYENLSITDDNNILVVKINQSGNLSVANDALYIEKADTIATQSGGYNDFIWTSAEQIAFISSVDGNNNIWQINIDGSGKKQLTKDAQIRRRIDFSEDGKYFVFESIRNGKVNLWRADADGNDFKPITNGDGESFPAISKDGSFIIYQNGNAFAKAGIRKINSDGTNIKEVYPNSGIRPQISPDQKRVAFFFMDSISATEQRWKIAIASIETGEILQKIDIPPTTIERFLRWTKSGEEIAFIDDKGNESSIIIQPLNQSKPYVKFKTTSGKIESFAWSPDGKKLAVNSLIEFRDAVLIKSKP